jgi:hypothetical protein
MVLTVVLTGLPKTTIAANTKVEITFYTSGCNAYDGVVFTIDGATYKNNHKEQWEPGSIHTVTAASSVTDRNSNVYSFINWTNGGGGLTTNTGTYTVPNGNTEVTANYAKVTTYTAHFGTSGLSNVDSNVLQIDGTNYTVSSLSTTSFLWTAGTPHTVTALQPVYNNWPGVGYSFSNWTNGNGLVSASGTFTMPYSDATVTANYAKATVQVTFGTTGLSNLNSDTILTIDGVTYTISDIPNIKLQWLKGSTHSVTAVSSVTGWDNVKHDFSSWTNGNGLTTNSGTFTTPTSDVVVTLNYAISTTTNHIAKFATTGLSNINGDAIEIDGTRYPWSNIPSLSFTWATGSTHTIKALEPVYNYYPGVGYNFSSWTNGNGLVTASGTFTMPNSDVTVTANYVQSTVEVTFATSGLTNIDSYTLLTIDGVNYNQYDLANAKFQWLKTSTHSITAVNTITGTDNAKHDFSSWTNGNGLVTYSGTFTTPNSNVLVTANYVTSTTTNHVAKFATAGLSDINGNALRIDGVNYAWSDVSSQTFNWAAGSNHTITALQPVYDYSTPPKGFNFTSWTNGNGLVTASGTFTMPNSDVTVIANYVQSTVQVTFATNGLANINSGNTILTVDGVNYDYWGIINFKAQWMKGSTHTVTAVSSITGWDNVKNDFSSWTNGDGLSSNSGTYTTPASDVVVTANYVTSSTTNYYAMFTTGGLTNIKGNVLQIDGVSYAFSDLPSKSFLWAANSTHTVTALQPVYDYSTPSKGYNFTSWTNGNGLVTLSGTFTMPASNVTVTANYVQATVQVTFSTNGLSNLDEGQNILTVDGTSYDFWEIINFKAQWMPGTTHSVSAVTSIAGWDLVTHYFRSWTNGNGLTSNSGTFTTPTADVAVVINYGLTQTITTAVTVECSVTSVAPGSPVTIMGALTGEGLGVAGKTISLSYYNGASWVSIGSATTTSSGYYSYGWTLPSSIAEGEYPLKATFGGDVLYLASSGSTGTPGNGGNVHVLPESDGSIVALFACLAGSLVFIGIRARKGKRSV